MEPRSGTWPLPEARRDVIHRECSLQVVKLAKRTAMADESASNASDLDVYGSDRGEDTVCDIVTPVFSREATACSREVTEDRIDLESAPNVYVGGAGSVVCNGLYKPQGSKNGRLWYKRIGGGDLALHYGQGWWLISEKLTSGTMLYSNRSRSDTPPVRDWMVDSGLAPSPTVVLDLRPVVLTRKSASRTQPQLVRFVPCAVAACCAESDSSSTADSELDVERGSILQHVNLELLPEGITAAADVSGSSASCDETRLMLIPENLMKPDLHPGTVFLHVYCSSQQLAGAARMRLGGAFHVSVEVFGTEWSTLSSTGITGVMPRTRVSPRYFCSMFLGSSTLTEGEVASLLHHLHTQQAHQGGQSWSECAFASELCIQLGVGTLPPWVEQFARAINRCTQLSSRHRSPAEPPKFPQLLTAEQLHLVDVGGASSLELPGSKRRLIVRRGSVVLDGGEQTLVDSFLHSWPAPVMYIGRGESSSSGPDFRVGRTVIFECAAGRTITRVLAHHAHSDLYDLHCKLQVPAFCLRRAGGPSLAGSSKTLGEPPFVHGVSLVTI